MTVILYPVILRVPDTIQTLNGKGKVAALSRFARESAKASALKSKLFPDRFETDVSGVPMPSKDVYWSVSHKPGFVAGVVSKETIGIDLEQIRNVSDALFKRVMDPDEAFQFKDQDRQIAFFRAFTAKEAVLKKTTHGIKGLSKAKIKTVMDDKKLIIQYSDRNYLVENFYFDGYLASVTKDHFDVQWILG